jgi:outer membrane receptor protein involved in Fe transport
VRFAGAQRRLSLRDRDDPRIDPSGTPGWYTISVRLGVQLLERLGLRALVDNLLDRRYREHGSGIDAAGENAVLSVDARF